MSHICHLQKIFDNLAYYKLMSKCTDDKVYNPVNTYLLFLQSIERNILACKTHEKFTTWLHC